ncbi:hypothetical protein ACXZ66_10995 [Corynebacterium sp. S7]
MGLSSFRRGVLATAAATAIAMSAATPAHASSSVIETSSNSDAAVVLGAAAVCAAGTGLVAGGASIVSQLNIAGLGDLAAEADRRVKEAISGIQQDTGIYNEELAQMADRASQYAPQAAGAIAATVGFGACTAMVSNALLSNQNVEGEDIIN